MYMEILIILHTIISYSCSGSCTNILGRKVSKRIPIHAFRSVESSQEEHRGSSKAHHDIYESGKVSGSLKVGGGEGNDNK